MVFMYLQFLGYSCKNSRYYETVAQHVIAGLHHEMVLGFVLQ